MNEIVQFVAWLAEIFIDVKIKEHDILIAGVDHKFWRKTVDPRLEELRETYRTVLFTTSFLSDDRVILRITPAGVFINRLYYELSTMLSR
jgi:hypothetical protein